MNVCKQAIHSTIAENSRKMVPYLKQAIAKMERCLEDIERLPPCKNQNDPAPEDDYFFANFQSEIVKNAQDILFHLVTAYWLYTKPETLAEAENFWGNHAANATPESVMMSDAYKKNFCIFEVGVAVKNDWLLVKLPPLPSRYKRHTSFKSSSYVDYSPLYTRELNASLYRKFASFSDEERMKFYRYPRKNIAYIFADPAGASHVSDLDNRDTKKTTDIICEHMLTDDGARCTSFEFFYTSDEVLPVGTYVVVTPNYQDPPPLSALIAAINATKFE